MGLLDVVPRLLPLIVADAAAENFRALRRLTADMARRYLQAFALGIPLVYALLLALAWDKVGTRDFDQFFVFHQLQDWNYQLFGFAKQWTPLLCSGLSLAGEPQVPLLSLSMLLSYAFGAARGTRSCHHPLPCLGWIGAYLYAGLYASGGFSMKGAPASCGTTTSPDCSMLYAMSCSRGSSGVQAARPTTPMIHSGISRTIASNGQ